MIVTSLDSQNIAVIFNNLEAKLLVECLRQFQAENEADSYHGTSINASSEVNKSGFTTLASDVDAATSSFISIVGFYTDGMVRRLADTAVDEPEVATPKEQLQ